MATPWKYTGQLVPRAKQAAGTAALEHPARDTAHTSSGHLTQVSHGISSQGARSPETRKRSGRDEYPAGYGAGASKERLVAEW
jgi:hypothetical protein